MKYIFLAYQDQETEAGVPGTQREALEKACRASEQELVRRGYLEGLLDLQNQRATVYVGVVDGRSAVLEEGAARVSGQPVRLFLIEARDLNEAIRAAAGMPQARIGPIEVRQILDPGPG